MPSYEVVKPCYVPFGTRMKYKAPGQVVTLDVEEAKKLDGYVRPTDQAAVRNPDTTVVVRNPDSAAVVRNPDTTTILEGEVDSDVGDAQAGDE